MRFGKFASVLLDRVLQKSEAKRGEKKRNTKKPPPPAFETGHTVRSGRSTRPPLRPTTPPA
ncbi:hypothetical protein T09_9446 [Trichinella sp. T9]|nr:hypothetical protein T09_9446 [Trichinella sp. T9]